MEIKADLRLFMFMLFLLLGVTTGNIVDIFLAAIGILSLVYIDVDQSELF